MKKKILLGAVSVVGVGGLVALGFGLNWVNKGLDHRKSVLQSREKSCLEASGLFGGLSMNDTLRSDPERWDVVSECAVYVDNMEENTPYLVFITQREGDWASADVKKASMAAYDAFVVRAKAAKSDIEMSN